jgi:hypothetical protein
VPMLALLAMLEEWSGGTLTVIFEGVTGPIAVGRTVCKSVELACTSIINTVLLIYLADTGDNSIELKLEFPPVLFR